MKRKYLAVVITAAISSLALIGCEHSEPSPPTIDDLVHKEATKASLEQSNREQQELKEFLAAARERDPSVVDAYYSVDEKGNKVINLVRNTGEKDDSGMGVLETVGMAMVGGMVGSMLANALVPNNPPSNYYRNNSAYYRRMNEDDERRYRGGAVAAYNNHMVSQNIQSVRNSPTKMSNIKASHAKLTTSKPAFQSKSGSSARSSSYSGRGG